MRLPFTGLLALLLSIAACAPKEDTPTTLKVATAANVQFAMQALAEEFRQQTGIKVEATISSSGKLTAQILEGAPYDLLISANMKYPEALLRDSAAVGNIKVYALGALVAWTMNGVPLQPKPDYMAGENIRKIAVANPKNAPYGVQALNYLQHYGMLEAVEPKLVYGESIAQTNQYILSRAAEVGITAKSVVLSPELKDKGRWVELPAGSYQPITQGAVITAYGAKQHAEASRQFFDFLSAPEAQAIFRRFGYTIPAE